MGFWRIVFTIILPPLGVLLGKGFGWAFILNIILTLLGYIPRPDPRLLGADPRLKADPRRLPPETGSGGHQALFI